MTTIIRHGQAVFLSRASAHQALIREGRRFGVSDEDIAKRGRAVAVSKRGEHLGYAAFLPQLPAGYITEEL